MSSSDDSLAYTWVPEGHSRRLILKEVGVWGFAVKPVYCTPPPHDSREMSVGNWQSLERWRSFGCVALETCLCVCGTASSLLLTRVISPWKLTRGCIVFLVCGTTLPVWVLCMSHEFSLYLTIVFRKLCCVRLAWRRNRNVFHSGVFT